AMYREVAMRVTGQPHGSLFLAVSVSIDCGRYPVPVFELDAPDVNAWHALFRRDLTTYHECRINAEWGGVGIIKRP
ncbi:exodeoxyribonuclease VIII, partial [Escherichia coli]